MPLAKLYEKTVGVSPYSCILRDLYESSSQLRDSRGIRLGTVSRYIKSSSTRRRSVKIDPERGFIALGCEGDQDGKSLAGHTQCTMTISSYWQRLQTCATGRGEGPTRRGNERPQNTCNSRGRTKYESIVRTSDSLVQRVGSRIPDSVPALSLASSAPWLQVRLCDIMGAQLGSSSSHRYTYTTLSSYQTTRCAE